MNNATKDTIVIWNKRYLWKYSGTSSYRPPWGQNKVAVVERWPLWGGRGVIYFGHILLDFVYSAKFSE